MTLDCLLGVSVCDPVGGWWAPQLCPSVAGRPPAALWNKAASENVYCMCSVWLRHCKRFVFSWILLWNSFVSFILFVTTVVKYVCIFEFPLENLLGWYRTACCSYIKVTPWEKVRFLHVNGCIHEDEPSQAERGKTQEHSVQLCGSGVRVWVRV